MKTDEMVESNPKGEESISCSEDVEATHNADDMTPEEEKRLVRKMDLHIYPIIIALYFLSFLDRVNIGELPETL
jgi:hypothetical protein